MPSVEYSNQNRVVLTSLGSSSLRPTFHFSSMLVRPPLTLLTFFPVSVGRRSFHHVVHIIWYGVDCRAFRICSSSNGRNVPRSVVHIYKVVGPFQIVGIDSAIRKVPFDDAVNRRDAKTPNFISTGLPEFPEHVGTCERYRGVRSGVIQPGRTVLTCYGRRNSHETARADSGNRATPARNSPVMGAPAGWLMTVIVTRCLDRRVPIQHHAATGGVKPARSPSGVIGCPSPLRWIPWRHRERRLCCCRQSLSRKRGTTVCVFSSICLGSSWSVHTLGSGSALGHLWPISPGETPVAVRPFDDTWMSVFRSPELPPGYPARPR